MKPINYMPAKTSAYHLWSLYLWQCKYEAAVMMAQEIFGGVFAFWSKRKSPLFAKTLAVVEHDRCLRMAIEHPNFMQRTRSVLSLVVKP